MKIDPRRCEAVMQWELKDAGPLTGPVHIQVGTLTGGGWYVRHTGFGVRSFDDKKAAWAAVRGLMGHHEGRWQQTSPDSTPFSAICRPDGSRVLYDMNDNDCLYCCWGDLQKRTWDTYMRAMSAGTRLRSTETHQLFGGSIELIAYDDPRDGDRRYVVVIARDPGSDYLAIDYPDRRPAETEYEKFVCANADREFPYRLSDVDGVRVDFLSELPPNLTQLPSGEIISSVDVHEHRKLYGNSSRTDWPRSPEAIVPPAPVAGMTASPRDWGPGEMAVQDVTPAAWRPDEELQPNALALAALPDGQEWLASAHDGAAHVWSLGDGESVRTVSGHSEWVLSAALTVLGDGRVALATGGKDGLARLWSPGEGEALAEIEVNGAPVNAVAWALLPGMPPLLVTGGDDAAVRIWDLETESELDVLEMGQARIDIVTSVATAVLSDGHLCVAAAVQDWNRSVVHVWDAMTRTTMHKLVIEHTGTLWPKVAMTTLVDRSFRVAATAGPVVRVWDGHTGEVVRSWSVAERGPGDVALAAMPDLRVAVAATNGPRTLVWDAESGTLLTRLDHEICRIHAAVDLAATPDGGLLLATGRDDDHPARILRLRPSA